MSSSVSAPAHGVVRRWLSPLVDPAVFDFWAGQIHPAWSWNRSLATVVKRHVEARGTVTLTLRTARRHLTILPGQHLNISAEVNGRRVTRSYSPTRIDPRKGILEITVKHVSGGVLSDHLCHHAQMGDVIELGRPFGTMTWPAKVEGKWLMLAAGSGITPLMSLIRAVREQDTAFHIELVYWARTRADMGFLTELRTLALTQPGRFNLHVVLTREADLLAGESRGRLDEALLNALVPDWSERQILACGPAEFVGTGRTLAAQRGAVFTGEAFTPVRAPSLGASLTQPAHGAAHGAAANDAAGPGPQASVRITLQASGRAVDIPSGEALLPALEAKGITLPYGCRMGVCHTCVCQKASGTTQDLQSGEHNSQPDAAVRLCVSSASSDLTLDL